MLDRGPFTNQYKNEFSLKSLIDKLSFKIFDADAKITVLFRGKEMMRFYKATNTYLQCPLSLQLDDVSLLLNLTLTN